MGSRPPRRYRKFSAKGAEGIHNIDGVVGSSPPLNSSSSLTKSNKSTCSSGTGTSRQVVMSPQQCFQQKIYDGAKKHKGKEAIESEDEGDIDMLWRLNPEEEEEDDTEEYLSTAESNPSNEDEMKEMRTMMMIRKLKQIVPGAHREMNTAAVLDEAVKYIKFLQL